MPPDDCWSNASSPRIQSGTLTVPSEHTKETCDGESSPIECTRPDDGPRDQDERQSQSSSCLKIMPDDSPATFVGRVKRFARPQEVAGLLTEKADSFHRTALRLYMQDYDFVNDAIDIAVRKLLLKLHLPRETQEIDRTMEAFAERYHECNPALFLSRDQPYILAFSIIMLHTDAFNRSNKSKMSRPDYVKNTKVEGISSNLLEYIYDNVVYAPFVYAEDLTETLGQKASDRPNAGASLGANTVKERNKLEVYRMIASGQLSRLRVDLSLLVPIKNPFSYTGTVAFFDCSALHSAFTHAHTVDTASLDTQTASIPPRNNASHISSLRVTRVGVLERKDDIAVAGKKASSRKWKSWGVLLTDDHLILFRDINVVQNLQERILQESGSLGLPSQSAHVSWRVDFKPDEMIALNDLIVLYDFTYTRYTHVFRCLLPNGRQILLRASDEFSMNLWISAINYAATFCTTGIRLRLSSDGDHGKLNEHSLPPMPDRWPVNSIKASMATTISAGSTLASSDRVVPDSAPLEVSGGATKDVSDSLVFARSVVSDLNSHSGTAAGRDQWHASRGDIVRSKIMDLESRIHDEQQGLASDIRDVRNLAILTPFSASSRQRLQQAARSVAGKVRRTRQTIAKLICYRECLCRDLLATERNSRQEKQRAPLIHSDGSHSQAWPFGKPSAADDFPQDAHTVRQESGSGSARMHKSASQDEIVHLMRSPSLLKRSLTSQMQGPYETVFLDATSALATQNGCNLSTSSSQSHLEQKDLSDMLQASLAPDDARIERLH